MIQGLATYFVIQDKVQSASDIPLVGPYLETDETLEYGKKGDEVTKISNYDNLGYGFCVFCDPGEQCQTDFETYKSTTAGLDNN